jgi:hypothetical protein
MGKMPCRSTSISNLCLFDSIICFIFIIYLILFLNLGLDPPTICFTFLVGYHHHHTMKVPWERSEEQIMSSFWNWFSGLWSPIKVGIHYTSPKAHFSRLSTQSTNLEATNFPPQISLNSQPPSYNPPNFKP